MDFLDREHEYLELEEESPEAAEALRSIDCLLENVAEDDGEDKFYAINRHAVEVMEFVFRELKALTKGKEVKITCVVGDPSPTSGYIAITGRTLIFKEMPRLVKYFRLATVTEFFPCLNGNIEMYLTFHGLAKEIK